MISIREPSTNSLPRHGTAWATERSETAVSADRASNAHRNQDEASALHSVGAGERDNLDMARLASGDEQGLNSLMQHHATRLLDQLERIVKNHADAAELVQEAFIRVYWHRLNYQYELQFTRWLYIIGLHLAISLLRWRARRPEAVPLLETTEENSSNTPGALLDPAPTPREQAEIDEWTDALQQALARLPAQLREPLMLVSLDGCSQAEAATRLGCTVKAVEMRICYGRKHLRAELDRILNPWRCRIESAIRRQGPQ